MKVLGIDPGIQNTGLAVVERKATKYRLITSSSIKTDPTASEAERYTIIASEIANLITEHKPDLLSVESVYFNRNISSCITTAGVISICLVESERAGVPSMTITPQAVKSACGLGRKASKDRIIRIANAMFLTAFRATEHHEADAIFVATAAIMQSTRNAIAMRLPKMPKTSQE